MIPSEKTDAVSRALSQTFGTAEMEDIRRMTKGLSSDLLFRIVVRGSAYLLRIVMRINEQTDPARHFTCMQIAAEAGVAPRVWYAGVDDGVCITDFVEPVPLAISEARDRIPATLRHLHSLPAFPKAFNYATAHKGFIWRFRSASLVDQTEIDAVFPRYGQLCAVYPRLDPDMVSCHDDLKPENILFDGNRLWLVDWQAAFINDRYFDLAIVANFLVASEAEERRFLEGYFGHAADEYQRARFFLMRQVLHMFYAAVFVLLGSAGKPVDRSKDLSTFREFHERVWAGEIDLADNDQRLVYGRLHWARLLTSTRDPRFDEALKIVAERHAGEPGIERLLPVHS